MENQENQTVRFNDIFDKWADQYDATVYNEHGEYHEVFARYEDILATTVAKLEQPPGAVIADIGTGTGNLAAVAVQHGYNVLGIEPNDAMRELGAQKHPQIQFLSGHFLDLPLAANAVQGIITSYAFHHLTDEEKAQVAKSFYEVLTVDGTVVIADTMYVSEEEQKWILSDALAKGYLNLAEDLQREFYTSHHVLRDAFEAAGFTVTF
ncbi:MAG: class I SAM-dependent methyltransferase, partial [Tumebacillaceae bacterium]